MPVNISTAEDAFLLGSAEWQEFIVKFEQDWNAPAIQMMAAMMWQSIDPATMAELTKRVPDAVENVRKMVEGK